MKALVVYDSFFTNTEQIAQKIGAGLGDVDVVKVNAAGPETLAGLDLLVVGSPTRAFNASPAITELLKGLPARSLQGVRAAAFDTRYPMSEIEKTPVLKFFVGVWGKSAWAATHIARRLKQKGGELIASPEGFFVTGVEGPLMGNELARAEEWGRQIGAQIAG